MRLLKSVQCTSINSSPTLFLWWSGDPLLVMVQHRSNRQELMNRKLQLMIVKMLPSPHGAPGHISATDTYTRTDTPPSRTLISSFSVAVATDCRISSLCPPFLTISFPFSLFYIHPLNLPSSLFSFFFFSSVANEERAS